MCLLLVYSFCSGIASFCMVNCQYQVKRLAGKNVSDVSNFVSSDRVEHNTLTQSINLYILPPSVIIFFAVCEY